MSARRSSPRPRGPVPDRVVELVRVRAGDLAENPKNWRRHPERQRAALRGLLREIGYADALLARRDGHLRKSLGNDQIVPVLVLDLDEREADTLLATLDPIAALAEADPGALAALLEDVETSSAAVLELLDGLRRGAGLPLVPVFGHPDDVPGRRQRPAHHARRWRGGLVPSVVGVRPCGGASSIGRMRSHSFAMLTTAGQSGAGTAHSGPRFERARAMSRRRSTERSHDSTSK